MVCTSAAAFCGIGIDSLDQAFTCLAASLLLTLLDVTAPNNKEGSFKNAVASLCAVICAKPCLVMYAQHRFICEAMRILACTSSNTTFVNLRSGYGYYRPLSGGGTTRTCRISAALNCRCSRHVKTSRVRAVRRRRRLVCSFCSNELLTWLRTLGCGSWLFEVVRADATYSMLTSASSGKTSCNIPLLPCT